jgi:hypothetical protein
MAMSTAKMKNLLENNVRPGESIPENREEETNTVITRGLLLSEIQLKPLDWFHYNPENEIFRYHKTNEYFKRLEKDIIDANAIINPLIAMPDGLLVEGESRHVIARKLNNAGNNSFAKIPVRIILSKITKDKITERLYLGNLSRFDIPLTTKLLIYAKIWPDYFLAKTDGSEGGRISTKKEIAEVTGLSESQIKRDKSVIQKAAKMADREQAPLSVEHVREAQGDKSGKTDEPDRQKSKGKYDLKTFHSLFSRKGPEYIDFSIKFIAELRRNSFISNASLAIVNGLLQKMKEKKKT